MNRKFDIRDMLKNNQVGENLALSSQLGILASEGKWGEIENKIADGNQSKTPSEYLKHWLSISRCFGYATQDGSWNEFEKEFAIIISRMLRAEAELKAIRKE